VFTDIEISPKPTTTLKNEETNKAQYAKIVLYCYCIIYIYICKDGEIKASEK